MLIPLLMVSFFLGLAMFDFGGTESSDEENMTGTDSPERLNGTSGNDFIDGAGGSDLILGFEGNDTLVGGSGDDWIFGMDGDDSIEGGDGNDVISGGRGSDTINAGSGDDFVETAGILDEAALRASLNGAESFTDITFRYDYSNPDGTGSLVDLGSGNDTIVAGGGDLITTGEGSDHIVAGDWVSGQTPMIITDFNPSEDSISFAYDRSGPAPVITARSIHDGEDTEVLADGEVFALLEGVRDGQFDPSLVVLRGYRA